MALLATYKFDFICVGNLDFILYGYNPENLELLCNFQERIDTLRKSAVDGGIYFVVCKLELSLRIGSSSISTELNL